MQTNFTSFISLLFSSRDQAHVFHLRSLSYAQHKALNEYYDEILDLIDGLVESYQGKYGLVQGYEGPRGFNENAGSATSYFEQLAQLIENTRSDIVQDSYLQNQVDEVLALVYSTIYKLKFLQ